MIPGEGVASQCPRVDLYPADCIILPLFKI